MNAIKHGENLWQGRRLIAFNNFFVQEEDGLTLVDTNLPGTAGQILEAVRGYERPIKRIVLTHAHADHAGSLKKLLETLKGVEVLMSQRTANMLNGDFSLHPDEPQSPSKGSFTSWSGAPSHMVVPGEMVGSLRVLAAPGHSPDQIALLDERDGTLIAGDAFQTQGGIAVSGIRRWRFPFPSMATWDLPTALQTAQALLVLNPNRLAVGHGPVIDQPVEAMETAVRVAGEVVGGS